MKFTRLLTVVVLSALLVFLTIQPDLLVAQAPQEPNQQTVTLLAQQAQVILPTDPRFNGLLMQFSSRIGLSGPGLANAFLTSPQASPVSLGNGIVYYPLVSAQNLNMTQVANGQIQATLMGVMTVPQGATLGGTTLPQRLGVAAMTGSFVVVLIDLSTGAIIAFLILPDTLILSFLFFPAIIIIQVIVQLIFIPIFPFIFFPFFLACPALPNVLPVNVPVGSGAILVTNPAFQIQEGGLFIMQPNLLIKSFGPSLQFTLMSVGSLQIGFIGGGSTGRARLPIGIPFRLLVQGGGKTACLQAAVISYLFGMVITGTLAYN